MIKENKVSLWLGFFENANKFKDYTEVFFDEDGNDIPSIVHKSFDIERYDMDRVECDWISDRCSTAESLLTGFSGDYEIIPQFSKMLEDKNIEKYNSIVLLYNFEYTGINRKSENFEFIGCADISL